MEFLDRNFNKEDVRSFVDTEGVVWFHSVHVCRVLEYKNPSVSIVANVDEADRQKIDIGGLNDTWFINKCGLYDLILACKKPVAKPFHKWLSHTLLPELETKGYAILRKDENTLAAAKAEIQKYETENLKLSANNQALTSKISELETTQNQLIDTSYQLMVATIKINSVISEWSIDLVPGLRKGLKPQLTKDDMRSLLAKLTSGVNRLLEVDAWVQAIDSVMLDLPDDLEDEDYELKKRVFDDFTLQLTKRRLKNL